MRGSIGRFLNAWKARDEQRQQRLSELRKRDGDNCRRCRRPIRFDLPSDHDSAPAVVHVGARPGGDGADLDDLCLCHARCNAEAGDSTLAVQERLKQRLQAEPAPQTRKRRKRSTITRSPKSVAA